MPQKRVADAKKLALYSVVTAVLTLSGAAFAQTWTEFGNGVTQGAVVKWYLDHKTVIKQADTVSIKTRMEFSKPVKFGGRETIAGEGIWHIDCAANSISRSNQIEFIAGTGEVVKTENRGGPV